MALLLPIAASFVGARITRAPSLHSVRMEVIGAGDVLSRQYSRSQCVRELLADAVSAERYAAAAELRDELAALLCDEHIAVLHANEQFYSALRSRNEGVLSGVWADGALAAACTRTYPGFAPLQGRSAILATWRQVNSDQHVELQEMHCTVLRGDQSAVVMCTERRPGLGAGDDTLRTTNLFEKDAEGGRWHLILHQSVPVASPDETLDDYDEVEYDAEDFPGATG